MYLIFPLQRMVLSKEAVCTVRFFILSFISHSCSRSYFNKCYLKITIFSVMISRTLGPEFGGAIGTLFFFANIVGSALAITGCVEGIVDTIGPHSYYGGDVGLISNDPWWRFLYCSIINTLMLIVCLVGASLFAKSNVLTLGIVVVCLISTFVSFLLQSSKQVMYQI